MSFPRRTSIISIEGRRRTAILSTHYYILSLGAERCSLFEAFRDLLIEVENQGFPVTSDSSGMPVSAGDEHMRQLVLAVDECFGHYYLPEPLGLILVGDRDIRRAFSAVTSHGDAVIGRIDGDHTGTSSRDLGQIVWPAVKEAMSGMPDMAMRDLEICTKQERSISGIEAVALAAETGERGTLLVEDDYHLKGRIGITNERTIILPDIDVRDVVDDAVDAVIDKVLESGGNVIFVPGGSLTERNKIVLCPA